METEVEVEYEPKHLSEGGTMDRFVFTCTDVEKEKLIASDRVPQGQAIYEFARDLAQKTFDEGDSAA